MRRLASGCAAWLLLWTLALAGAAPAWAAKPGESGTSTLRPFDTAAATALRQQHAGKPWVLVLWSISCEPCREEMPHWAKLRREHPELAIELVSTDGEGEKAMARQFLARSNLGDAPGWIFADDYVERLRYAIDPGWHGELPRTLFHDASGRAIGRSGIVDSAWLADWVRRQREPK